MSDDNRVQLELELFRREAARAKALAREQYRRDHPDATGTDAAIDAVMEIEALARRSR